jgi:hypothetical protein
MSYFTTKRRMEAQPKKEVPPPRPPPVDGAYHATVIATLERQHRVQLEQAVAQAVTRASERIEQLDGFLREEHEANTELQKANAEATARIAELEGLLTEPKTATTTTEPPVTTEAPPVAVDPPKPAQTATHAQGKGPKAK